MRRAPTYVPIEPGASCCARVNYAAYLASLTNDAVEREYREDKTRLLDTNGHYDRKTVLFWIEQDEIELIRRQLIRGQN